MDFNALPPISSLQMPHSIRPVVGFLEEILRANFLLVAGGGAEGEAVDACCIKDVWTANAISMNSFCGTGPRCLEKEGKGPF